MSSRTRLAWLSCALVSSLFVIVPVALDFALDGSVHGSPQLACKNGASGCETHNTSIHWCETVHWEEFMRTKFNSISAMAFSFAGLAMLTVLYLDHEPQLQGGSTSYWRHWAELGDSCMIDNTVVNHVRVWPAFSVFYATMLILGGVGSFYNHASVTRYSRELDRATIWGMLIPPCVATVLRFVRFPPHRPPHESGTSEGVEEGARASLSEAASAARLEKCGDIELQSHAEGSTAVSGDDNDGGPRARASRLRRLYSCCLVGMCCAVTVCSLMHLLFGESDFATPVLYVGLPCLVLVGIGAVVIRPLLSSSRGGGLSPESCCYGTCKAAGGLQALRSRHRFVVFTVVCFVLAVLLQDPRTLVRANCDPDGPWWTMTHGYWHVLIAAGQFSFWWYLWTEEAA
jgi:hypothetical protein